jgi:DNA-binding NarL/FixJ family response regulator
MSPTRTEPEASPPPTCPAVVRIVIADDQPLVRSGLAMLLGFRPDMEVVAEAADGRDALAAIDRHRPDIALLDVRMPELDGLGVVRELAARQLIGIDAPTRVVMLSTYHVDEAVYAALRLGASGFVLKDAAPDELVAALHAVAAGEAWLDPAVARRLVDTIRTAPNPGLATRDHELDHLTGREREVLVLIGHGLNNRELAERLGVSGATVKTHIQRILFKLHLRDRVQAVILTYELGLVQPGPDVPGRHR